MLEGVQRVLHPGLDSCGMRIRAETKTSLVEFNMKPYGGKDDLMQGLQTDKELAVLRGNWGTLVRKREMKH